MKKLLFFISPLYWPAWLGFGLLWLIIQLPHHWRMNIGRWLGKLLHLFPTSIKHTTDVNLAICFPELSEQERKKLAKKNFESLGIALIESAMAWWSPDHKLQNRYVLHGLENLEHALAKGKGVIVLAPHFTCLELIGRLMGLDHTFGVMYRPHKKPFIAFIHGLFRKKYYETYIPSNRVRQLIQALQENQAIWYAYDIDGGMRRSSVFAPFFGVPTATLTTVSRLAKMTGAQVLTLSAYREDNDTLYSIFLSEALTDFPTDDLVTDATHLNSLLEKAIRLAPEQYVWQYKRFKTRPKGLKRFYCSQSIRR